METELKKLIKKYAPNIKGSDLKAFCSELNKLYRYAPISGIKVDLDRIRDIACNVAKICPERFHSAERYKNNILARQLFCYYVRENYTAQFTLHNLAKYVGRGIWGDHATVCAAAKKFSGYLQVDQYSRDTYAEFLKILKMNGV